MKQIDPRFLRVCEILLKINQIDLQRMAVRASAEGFNEIEVEQLLASIDRNEAFCISSLRAWCDRYM